MAATRTAGHRASGAGVPVAFIVWAAAITVVLGCPSVVAADTFVVNKRGDHAPNGCTPSDCTAREAVIRANNHAGPDRIKLPSQKPYRLKIDPDPMEDSQLSGDLNVEEALTILHPGSGRATIDAEGVDRIVENEARLTLRKLKLRGGSSPETGGAVLARSNLKVIAGRIVANHAQLGGGGIATGGPADVTLRRTTVANNWAPTNGGGGILFTGDELKIVASTIARNLAGCKVGICIVDEPHGGGLRVAMPAAIYAEAMITRSSFFDNEAWGNGGAVANDDRFQAVNSTITRNRADGDGGGLYGGPESLAKLNAITIARNRADADGMGGGSGGGAFGDGGADVIEIRNSLVVRNKATGGAVQECDAPAPVGIASLGGNLITSADPGGCVFFTHPQDIVDPEPRIGKLRNYGGPTKTIKLRAGSPAINQADGPNPPNRDQRAVQRQNPDIGAFERG